MTLTPEEKQKIEEEEKHRAEARKKYEQPKKKGISKRLGCLIFIVIFALIVLISTLAGGDKTSTNTSTATPTTNKVVVNTSQVNTNSAKTKAEAQKELDELMDLSKQSDLVTTYEFSDSATVVYVGSTWYTQTVQFKKDFLAKVAMLKETITGYKHFEARDALSNEKVGEVTSFSGSLEVYK